ncbi:uncharacterized protein MELLADRAFT_77557 [Melampsora larici-populina 98AG31]|uniref:Uncharacterized protein n=1 Tax=Melampsora larici-populina (strain 98AG31 / pathotype 3-4-7) TaxID=747676 RepID=F4RJ70_MELLP|nr:uncharacterized protein MELLADRAFT_77557 [Melampsora larici-populina 98AG31]EGG07702.1 hypothetical protein MELLADRAFT_77557 [Melampsora larici-populina 98AG31]
MQSSISIARATATLPRSWIKNITKGSSNISEARLTKRQEGANKINLILQKYLQRGIEPSTELLDSLDPTNLSFEGTISASSSCAGSLSGAMILEPTPPMPSSPKQPKRKPKKNQIDSERCKLIRKQTKRQSILPSFFEPNQPIPEVPKRQPKLPSSTTIPTKLTVEALSAHNHPVNVFLNPTYEKPKIRKSISFQTLPIIRIIKPIPECLDDHSNPSSRDPFYYDQVLKKIDFFEEQEKINKKIKLEEEKENRDRSGSQGSVGSGSVTAWFAEQYQD